MDLFFTSDTHYFHNTILNIGKGRPFDSIQEMNEALVDRWNARVKKDDLVYHLGDFTFGHANVTAPLVRRLNGQIYFIRGNHDKTMDRVMNMVPEKFAAAKDYKEIKVEGQRIVMMHFPILSWNQAHRGAWHLHGHCHQNLHWTNGPMLDVGVDGHDFAPWNVAEVAEFMANRPEWIPVDHHDKPIIVGEPILPH